MISRTLDSLTSKYPKFAEYCKKHIYYIFDTSDGKNIAVFLSAGIAAGILAGSTNGIIRYASLAAAFTVWIQTSVLAGFMRQWLYIFFSSVYFILPHIFIITPETAAAAQADELAFMISDIVQSVLLRPVRLIAGEWDLQTVCLIIFGACIVLFISGLRLRSTAKRSDFYCRTRLEQLE